MLRYIICKLWNFGHDWQTLSERHRDKHPVRRCQRCGYEQFRIGGDAWLSR